ncbi:MAG: tetratricopeptide repeat protein [Pseudomonadota bacterium]|nr:tetratricopeptide repeat protein [Pseudomonadota bacterium]
MAGPLLLHAPTPLEYFESLVADDASLSVLETAIASAHDDFPDLDCETVLADVDALAARLKARVPHDAVPMQRLRWLNRFFFQELGFSGNANDYYDPKNSYLHVVLQTRRGIPITLALLYCEIASQIGLSAHGISFPGHFLVKLRMPQGDVVIDPFNGQSMSRDSLDALLVPYRRRQGLPNATQLPLGVFLQAAESREIIARMLRNLKEIHRSSGEQARLLAVLDRLVVLLPRNWEERRDRGLAAAEVGVLPVAVADLTAYLEHAEEAPDRERIAERLVELGSAAGDRPRLH